MWTDAAREFLEGRLIARLASFGLDGYPHNVPVWYLLDGDDIVFISDRSARKTQNLLANGRAAVVIGGDTGDGAGYMVRGDVAIEEDAGQAMTRRMIYRYETKEEGDRLAELWKDDDIVILRLKPMSIIKVY
jgi:PPOX class probable F420-dependent enzyme